VSARALSDAARKHGKRLYPQWHAKEKGISAYTFRHAVAADLKTQSLPCERIAALMGHLTDDSQGHYAHGSGKSGGRRYTVIEGAPVRALRAKRLSALRPSAPQTAPKKGPARRPRGPS
jgi:integrase